MGETPLGDLRVQVGTREVIAKHPRFGSQRVVTSVSLSAPAEVTIDFTRRGAR